LIQNNPKLLQKKSNIEECRNLLADKKTWTNFDSKDKLEEIDLIAFPEMAFTGYNFENDKHVLPLACFVN
jgi:predicted amidohydrolase